MYIYIIINIKKQMVNNYTEINKNIIFDLLFDNMDTHLYIIIHKWFKGFKLLKTNINIAIKYIFYFSYLMARSIQSLFVNYVLSMFLNEFFVFLLHTLKKY